MNVWAEVERRTAPLPKASPVRLLSREEIEALQAAGQVTSVEQIPALHGEGREIVPTSWLRGRYGYYRDRC